VESVAFADSDCESDDESDDETEGGVGNEKEDGVGDEQEDADDDEKEDEEEAAGDAAAELVDGGDAKAHGSGIIASDAEATLDRQSTPLTSIASSGRADPPKRVVIRNYSRATVLAWVHWIMTGEIEFAPPSALGNEIRAVAIQRFKTTYPDRIPPVSAQSIYRIAEQCVRVSPCALTAQTRLPSARGSRTRLDSGLASRRHGRAHGTRHSGIFA